MVYGFTAQPEDWRLTAHGFFSNVGSCLYSVVDVRITPTVKAHNALAAEIGQSQRI
jgi:hypothetical protein